MDAPRLPRRAGKARTRREAWPRVGAVVENGAIVVRFLADGESPHPALRRAVLQAEPCSRFRTVLEAGQQAAATLAERLRARGAKLPVIVAVN